MSAGFTVTQNAGAQGYDRVMDALAPPAATAEALAGLVRADDTVLEVGCGTGRATHAIADRARRVIGLDLSTEMLERFVQRGVPENVELRAGDATDPASVEAASVDLVTCLLGGLQYVRDLDEQARIAWNLRRWLRPGGRVAVEMFDRAAYDALLGHHRVPLILDGVHWWLTMDVSRDGETYTSVSSVRLDGDEGPAAGFTEVFRPTDADEARDWLAAAGFEEIEVRPDFANRGFLWVSAASPFEPEATAARTAPREAGEQRTSSISGPRPTPTPRDERNRP